ncbi:glycosyltransferase family 87 protein [Nesterenkonia xinjiangensis]|uniref:Putative membrane protein n=1 Tax=Nesterenkonia xinjiangensis TaxID=225327 RepID=A0A7Z0GLL5_9MICC|nr:glycosyltransferase 87 family protein [Nesterenkonia xinjiangensis]NYJ77993.1 putative membrane protein [Nesterenkonia xinjiangensis]
MTPEPRNRREVVAPTRADPLLRLLSDRVGGPSGTRLTADRRFWTIPRVLMAMTAVAALVSLLSMQHCRAEGWIGVSLYHHGCYSDVSALYVQRGLDADPWAPFVDGQWFEYPVLTSLLASLAALVTRGVDGVVSSTVPSLAYWEGRLSLLYWDVTFLGAVLAWFLLVLTVMRAAGRRPWDAAIVATSPAIIFGAGINWDLWATAALLLAVLAHLRGQHLTAGALIGVGVSFKLFPLFLLGALFVLALRRDGLPWSALGRTVAASAVSWALLNVPAMLLSWENWSQFWSFSAERGSGYSSIWHVWQVLAEAQGSAGPGPELVSTLSLALFLACCTGVLLLGLRAPVPPRTVQLLLLIVAAFALVNKVYSPQFMIWLIPLIALAAPRWRDVLIWQAAQVLHFWAVWMYLAGVVGDAGPQHTMADGVYLLAVLGHMAATAWIMAVVVRDMYRPECDVVRHPPVLARR